jgi:hypothetical protein
MRIHLWIGFCGTTGGGNSVLNNTTQVPLAELMDLSASDYAAGDATGSPVCTPSSCLCCYGGHY